MEITDLFEFCQWVQGKEVQAEINEEWSRTTVVYFTDGSKAFFTSSDNMAGPSVQVEDRS